MDGKRFEGSRIVVEFKGIYFTFFYILLDKHYLYYAFQSIIFFTFFSSGSKKIK